MERCQVFVRLARFHSLPDCPSSHTDEVYVFESLQQAYSAGKEVPLELRFVVEGRALFPVKNPPDGFIYDYSNNAALYRGELLPICDLLFPYSGGDV